MHAKESGYLSVNPLQIYYEVAGNPEGIPIVFHHGFANCIADWYDLGYIDALKDRYQLILIDSLGFGKSSKSHEPRHYREALLMEYTIKVVSHLGLQPGEAVFYGNSMGGRLGYALLAYHPHWFKAFIIAGMHPYGPTELGPRLLDWLRKGIDYFVDQLEKFQPIPENIRQRLLENDVEAILAAHAYYSDREDLSAKLCAVKTTAPILLYAGSNDVAITKRLEGIETALVASGKNVTLKSMPGHNHCQTYWNGPLAAEFIDNFLEQSLRV